MAHVLDGSVEAAHHHLHAVSHFLRVSLQIQKNRRIDGRDVCWSPRGASASVDRT